MFRYARKRLRFIPQDGMKVMCFGSITLYEPRGEYQLTIERMEPRGVGALQLAFEQLKNKLAAEGLFDEKRKRPLPYLPQRIGVITSGTGAALVRSPIRLAQLRRVLLDQIMIARAQTSNAAPMAPSSRAALPVSMESDPPERRFDDIQLARLLEVSTSIDCECPNHISSLVAALVAFEDYSMRCEARDEADAALHSHLSERTALVRSQMESMLADVCSHEGISV